MAHRLRIGNVTITRIVERDGPWRAPHLMFPTADPAVARAHLRHMEPFIYDPVTDRLVITYQSFLVETPRHRILIDTCVGENKPGRGAHMQYPKEPWLAAFAATGVGFADIDYVFCTHLHVDHVGWNTRLDDGRWVPTFPNARYIFSRAEYEAWRAEDAIGVHESGPHFRDSVLPIVEAGRAILVADDWQLEDQVWLTPTPGHSPAHVCVNIRSNGVHAVFTGDMMHHALQCIEPDWSTCFCADPALAARSRRRVLGDWADRDILVLPTHFPTPTAGRIVSLGDAWRFKFIGG
ncbi:MAG: MBL fold metallo-hydrolase [Alphaproteobacteria bacterium]|nr:MBL fold metallo-hydrolase [Alphaproteobacteria bacterium]